MTYEREVRDNGHTLQRHFLSANGFVFAQITKENGTGAGPNQSRYLHYDHMGSIAAISDATGTVVERLAYDPWAKRRSSNGVADPLDALVGVNTDRGYTLHEHIDEVGVINMNGRVYDPLIGRFMSADPINQALYNLKSFNRYSYVWNNPLKLWDPSGYEIEDRTGAEVAQQGAKDPKEGTSERKGSRGIAGYLGSLWEGFVSFLERNQLGRAPTANEVQFEITRALDATGVGIAVGGAVKGARALEKSFNALEAERAAARALAAQKAERGVVFGTDPTNPHTVQHVIDLAKRGVSEEKARAAIVDNVASLREKVEIPVNASIRGSVIVDGVKIEYKGLTLTDTVINIGTYFAP